MAQYRNLIILSFICALLVALNSAPTQALSQEMSQAGYSVSPQEFYYFDTSGLRVPLKLSRVITVRFRNPTKNPDDKQTLLKQYAPLTIQDISSIYSGAEFALEYPVSTSQANFIKTIERMSADPEIEIAPAFMVDGIPALVAGLYVETAAPISAQTIQSALEKKFGNNLLNSIIPAGSAWHLSLKQFFFLENDAMQLHALSFANLLSKSETFWWVKRVYPRFVFLHEPVIAKVSVSPVSGTVGEERTVTLVLRIFAEKASDVEIADMDIPEFYQGNFIPMSQGKPPQASFIDPARGVEKKPRVQIGPNEWRIEHQYRFGMYAPEGEWLITGVVIPYMYKGEQRQLKVEPVTFLVRPHLDRKYRLTDIPAAFPISPPALPGFTFAEPVATTAWFDPFARVVGGRTELTQILYVLALITIVTTIVCGVTMVGRLFFARSKEHIFTAEDLPALFKHAHTLESPAEALRFYHEVLSQAFHAWDASFPRRNVAFQDIKDRLRLHDKHAIFARLEQAGIVSMFRTFESRHGADFDNALNPNEFTTLHQKMQFDIEQVVAMLKAEKKEAS